MLQPEQGLAAGDRRAEPSVLEGREPLPQRVQPGDHCRLQQVRRGGPHARTPPAEGVQRQRRRREARGQHGRLRPGEVEVRHGGGRVSHRGGGRAAPRPGVGCRCRRENVGGRGHTVGHERPHPHLVRRRFPAVQPGSRGGVRARTRGPGPHGRRRAGRHAGARHRRAAPAGPARSGLAVRAAVAGRTGPAVRGLGARCRGRAPVGGGCGSHRRGDRRRVPSDPPARAGRGRRAGVRHRPTDRRGRRRGVPAADGRADGAGGARRGGDRGARDRRPPAGPLARRSSRHAPRPRSATPRSTWPGSTTCRPPTVPGSGIAIVELGGGYADAELDTYFAGLGVADPTVTAVGVDGAANAPERRPERRRRRGAARHRGRRRAGARGARSSCTSRPTPTPGSSTP